MDFTLTLGQIIVTLLVFVFSYNYLNYRKKCSYWEKRGVPAAVYNPLMVLYRIISMPVHQMFEVNKKKFGSIYGFFEGPKPILMVSDPEVVRQVFVKDFFQFPNRKYFLDMMDEISQKMLVFTRDEDWRKARTLMSPTFTSGKMRKMFRAMNAVSEEAIEALQDNVNSGKEFDARDFAGKYTLDVIARCCFATKPSSHKNPDNAFLKNASKMFKISLFLILKFVLLPRALFKTLKVQIFPWDSIQYFKGVILQLIKERKEKDYRFDDFLQLLIDVQKDTNANGTVSSKDDNIESEAHLDTDDKDDSKKVQTLFDKSQLKDRTFTETDIVANSILFFAAGYETTSVLISIVLYQLALDQSIQDRLLAEIRDIGEPDKLDYEPIMSAKYLDAVISEALRLHSPVLVLDRESNAPYKVPGTDIQLDSGTAIQIPVSIVHRDPEYWPEPEKFDPDRFLPENRDQIKPYTYLPFGAGPRNCIGMRFALLEAKLLIAKLILKFQFVQTEKTSVPIRYNTRSGLLNFDPLLIGVKSRN